MALFSEAVLAAEQILEGYYRLPVSKALDPTNPKEYLVIVSRLAQSLQNAMKGHEGAALKAALEHLDVDWKGLDAAQKELVFKAAQNALKGALTAPAPSKLSATLEMEGKKVILAAKSAEKKTIEAKFEVKYKAQDKTVIDHAAAAQSLFVRDEYGKRADAASNLARKIVAAGLDKGLDRFDIAEQLSEKLTEHGVNRSKAYWTLIAGTFANRARTYGSLSAFEDAGYTRYIFEAVLDEVTTLQCRFMHGRSFDVRAGLKKYADTAASAPEEVKYIQPWLQTGKDEDGNEVLYWNQADGTRGLVATVTQNAYGKQDEVGAFTSKATNEDLQKLGISMPPLHGHCRSTIIVDSAAPTRAVVPAAVAAPAPPPLVLTPPEPKPARPAPSPFAAPLPPPPEQAAFAFGPGGVPLKPITFLAPQGQPVTVYEPGPPPKKSAAAVKAEALAKLAELKDKPDNNPIPLPKDDAKSAAVDAKAKAIAEAAKASDALMKALVDAKAAKAGSLWDADRLVSLQDKLDLAKVEALVKSPKALLEASKGILFVHMPDGQVYVQGGHEAVAAHFLMGKKKIAGQVITASKFDKVLKDHEAKAPPPPKPLDSAVVLAQKLEGAKGSNEGGVYLGSDGVKRYVKFYKDPAQAYGEQLAASVYRALGQPAPEVGVFQHDGRTVFASVMQEGQTLAAAGLTKERARQFFGGFAADILTANWDAAGAHTDNAFVTKAGDILRIDNGGTFLMRAQAGRKDAQYLNSITEWDYFFHPKNEGYSKVARAAGYSSPEDFKEAVLEQIDAVVKLRTKVGGWEAFVRSQNLGLSETDHAAVVKMLEARTDLLAEKARQLRAPKPATPRYDGPRLGGVGPSAKLSITDLPGVEPPIPVHDPERLPSGEAKSAYLRRAERAMDNVPQRSKNAISMFTGSHSGAIRRAEMAEHEGKPPGPAIQESKLISDAFASAKAEPGTVFRGIGGLSKETVEDMLRRTGVFRMGQGNTPATTSTSWSPSVAKEFMGGLRDDGDHKVFFIIRAKSAIPIQTISQHARENERLLHKNIELKMVSAARWKGYDRVVVIELEEV